MRIDVLVSHLVREQKLLLEAGDNRRIGSQFRPDQFQSHETVEFAVPGLVHRAHPALTQHLQNFVAATEHISRLQKGNASLHACVFSANRWRRRDSFRQSRVHIHERGIGVDRRRAVVN